MLKVPQGRVLWHLLPGLAIPSKSSLPSEATMVQVTETPGPALGQGLWDSTARETEKCTEIWVGKVTENSEEFLPPNSSHTSG